MEQREQQEVRPSMPPNIPIPEFRHDMPHVREFINVSTVAEYIQAKLAHQQVQLDRWTDKRPTAETEKQRLETMLKAVQRGETRGAQAELEKDISKLQLMKNNEGAKLKTPFPDNPEYQRLEKLIFAEQKKLRDARGNVEAVKEITETLRYLEEQLGKTQRGQIESRMNVLEAGKRKLTSLKKSIGILDLT